MILYAELEIVLRATFTLAPNMVRSIHTPHDGYWYFQLVAGWPASQSTYSLRWMDILYDAWYR